MFENTNSELNQPKPVGDVLDSTQQPSRELPTQETVPPQEPTSSEPVTVTSFSEPTCPLDVSVSPTTYRWEYDRQTQADDRNNRKIRRRGALTYAIVMTACFAVCFAILLATLFAGWGEGVFQPSDSSKNPSLGSNSVDSEGTLTMQQISAAGNRVVVAITAKSSLSTSVGTGIIMTVDGYIATNSHVVDDASTIVVRLYDGTEYRAELVGQSELNDLAVIKINASGLPCATFGKSSETVVGDSVVAIGHPAGLDFGWTSTYGRVSAINRDVKIRDTDGTLIKKMTLLQTDANVNGGNSGGPLFNDKGEVIGIITLKLAGNYEGLGFAIPIDAAMPLLTALMEHGHVDGIDSGVASGRPLLGINGVMVEKDAYYALYEDYIQRLTEEQAKETEGSFQALATGVLITGVLPNLDAQGKIEVGDIMIAIDGMAIPSFESMREYLYNCDVGDTVTIEYVRKDGSNGVANIVLKAAQ